MFEAFIDKQLPYDDHFRSITKIHEVSSEYSRDMANYASALTTILAEYNDKVEVWLDFENNNPMIEQGELSSLVERIDDLEEEYLELNILLNEAEAGSAEYEAYSTRVNEIEGEIGNLQKEYEEKLEELRYDTRYQNFLLAYESIQVLTSFYADPLYLSVLDGEETENAIALQTKKVWESFSNLQMVEAAFRDETTNVEHKRFEEKNAIELQKVFENYVKLSTFYAQQGAPGINFSNVLETINDKRPKTSEEYQEQTQKMLDEMIFLLNEVPMLTDIENIWSKKLVEAPAQTQYLDTIYNLYRDNSGTTQNLERALLKLVGYNSEKMFLAWQLVLIAFIMDISIVFLTLMRSKKTYSSNAADIRRLLGVLFLDDSIDEETMIYRKGQGFAIIIGILFGILFYILYTMERNSEVINGQEDLLSFLLFIMLGITLGLLVYRMYWKVKGYPTSWQKEVLYLKWKEIWTKDISNEEELQKRIAAIQNGQLPEEIILTENDIRNIVDLYQNKNERMIFEKYFYEKVLDLFSKLEMQECYKFVLNRKIEDKKTVNFSFESERMLLPCIKEKYITEFQLKTEFNVLKSKNLIGFDTMNNEGWYIMSDRFWSVLYDAVLLRVVGGRISDYDFEGELLDNAEEDNEF